MPWPGEALVIKLWETVTEKGIGSLVRPWHIRREGRALLEVKREQLLILAQAEKDAKDISTGAKRLSRSAGVMAIPTRAQSASSPADESPNEPDALSRAALSATTSDALRRDANVTRALLHAQDALADDADAPPDKTVDEDWLFRWRDYAGNISNEELSTLWGRLLAGEVKQPGKYSLRALELLKCISSSDAAAIAQIGPFVLGGRVIWREDQVLQGRGITLDHLLHLQQMGILGGVDSLGLTLTWKSVLPNEFACAVVCCERVLMVRHSDPSRSIALPICQLSSVGREIMTLGVFRADVGYLRAAGKAVQVQGFNVALGRWEPAPSGSIRTFDEVDLASSKLD
jgi:hypothetical protein